MKLTKQIPWLLLPLCLPAVATANSSQALQDYYNGNFEKAQPELQTLATKNDPKAMYALALMKRYGYGDKKDLSVSLDLMTRSAKNKYLPAQLYLAAYYFDSKHDLKSALVWFQAAAAQNQTTAELYTSIAYLNGYGVKANKDIARKYLIPAAQKGIPAAQYELAMIFLNSKYAGDKKMGDIWLKKAAEKGYELAKKQLKVTADTTGQLTNVSKIKNVGEKNSNEKIQLDNEALWNAMKEALKQAGIVIKRPEVKTADGEQQTLTPFLTTVISKPLLQPNDNLIQSKQIPLQNLIVYASQFAYQQQKPTLTILEYPFKQPVGTTNHAQALTTLQREARFGYPQALFKLGQMYEHGLNVDANKTKAFQLYEAGAQLHYQKAEYMLGVFYLQGIATKKDPEKAIDYFYRAALKGSTKAQFILGNIYEYGINANTKKTSIEINYQRAQSFYNLAAHHGNALAEYRLAQLYASGKFNPSNSFATRIKDIALAHALYQRAAQKGVANAKIAAAYFIDPNEKNQKNTFDLIDDASNNLQATLLLAMAYDRGFGTNPSESRAMREYKKLVKINNPFAEFALGTHYYLDGDKQDGLRLLKESANQGNPYSQYNLALLLKKGDYQDANETFASLLKKAADNDCKEAERLIADTYLTSNTNRKQMEQAANTFKKLAEKQDPIAELKLGILYENGIFFAKNETEALTWYQKAADHQNKMAQYFTGYFNLIGKGTDRNIKNAIYYFTQAAKQGYLPAEVALGFIHDMSLFDYQKAKTWYEKAADEDNPEAQYNLALIYKYGKGVDVSQWRANRLYKKSGIKNPLWDAQ